MSKGTNIADDGLETALMQMGIFWLLALQQTTSRE
jgi:hypothetical protein